MAPGGSIRFEGRIRHGAPTVSGATKAKGTTKLLTTPSPRRLHFPKQPNCCKVAPTESGRVSPTQRLYGVKHRTIRSTANTNENPQDTNTATPLIHDHNGRCEPSILFSEGAHRKPGSTGHSPRHETTSLMFSSAIIGTRIVFGSCNSSLVT